MSTTNSLTMSHKVPRSLLDTGVQGLIGQPLDRYEGRLKVAGTATYAAEYPVEHLAYGYLVQAREGAGKVRSIDVDAAKAVPGVIDVVVDHKTLARVAAQGGQTSAPTQGTQEISYIGQPVAIVVAESYEAARDAGERIVVAYDHAEGRYDFARFSDDRTTPKETVTPPRYKQGDLDKAMADAAVTVDETYTTPSQNSAAMEPHSSTAVWSSDGDLTMFGSYQMPTQDSQSLAKALGLPVSKVRMVSHYIGGGFGSKLGIAPEAVAAAVAAKAIGRPVKVAMARQQVFETTPRRSNTLQRVRLAAGPDGVLTGIGHESVSTNTPGETYYEPCGIGTHALYAGENRLITHELVTLNWGMSGSMRAPGEAVGMIAVEAAMDVLAEKVGIDPVELRKRNDPDRDPEMDVPYSSRQLSRCLDEGADRFGWSTRNATPAQVRDGEWLVGMGMAAATRNNQLMKSSASVRLDAAGMLTVRTSMTDIGTGTYTILAQIAGELLGLPIDRIRVELGDTRYGPSAGSGGSWGAASAGSAVYLAAEGIRSQIAKKLGVDPDDLTLKDGVAIAQNKATPLADLAGDGIEVTGEIAPGHNEKSSSQASHGAHFCEVGVNAVTGEVRVRRYLGVFSAGRILNAKTARSQCIGGITFGIGAALEEDLIHDVRNGKLVNRDLAEYHVPVNADVPAIEVILLPERDLFANPLHAKGIGELGISGSAAAIANAIYNACGVRVNDFPITCDKLLAGLPPM
ncbi:xanthine dehydrogenase family protein molybdopterin-binding subunit [uncultured Sphingomonas sp.]|uniref:xanthine dehydrogenase family protein molybdopterin-binding subunit n=1 Tax=uncultured Sphingomonas sp. TaxID=158754 RepID=UPI0035CB9CDF